ncbi:hypothetical protein [Allorhizocola rhizosphaerae]|uniref:hypothetical protein n=1 Tax=Allorhizocola rhizosphaerae TaxID=1872709 RepID=UPI000E3E16EB|nr:hypothetical protein [Allorhizocola rhizosphaerae]
MILASDGSTTVLLEALVGEELKLEVRDQETRPARTLEPRIRLLLDLTPEFSVLVRRSALCTPDGRDVSRNLVVARYRTHKLHAVFTSRTEPIGQGLMRLGLSRARRVVGTGVTDWDATVCAYKAYVVLDGHDPVAYIHERFNPSIVPCGQEVRA